jgi:predicted PurR-regulated permease PerM
MDSNTITLMIIAAILAISSVSIISVQLISFFRWSENSRKDSDERMASFLRHMHIESQKNSKEVQRMINKNHEEATRIINEMRKDTSIILGQIFERVDEPPENNAI